MLTKTYLICFVRFLYGVGMLVNSNSLMVTMPTKKAIRCVLYISCTRSITPPAQRLLSNMLHSGPLQMCSELRM